jgi:hypothetical protein
MRQREREGAQHDARDERADHERPASAGSAQPLPGRTPPLSQAPTGARDRRYATPPP